MFMASLRSVTSWSSCPAMTTRATIAYYLSGIVTRSRIISRADLVSRGDPIQIRLVFDRHLRTEPLQLLCQRFVVGACRLVPRIEFDGRAKIGQRTGPVALPAPEFTARVEDIGQRGIQAQCGVVVAYGAIDLIL